MKPNSKRPGLRRAVAARQVILLLILIVVAGAGAYEFGIARPAYESAWDKISNIDSSIDSGNYTAAQIEEMIGKKPVAIEEDEWAENVEIRTYRWQSGLPFRSHNIYVVYTRILPALLREKPELADVRYYYSASGGTPITESNLPAEKPTFVSNKNPPNLGGGAPGGGRPQPSGNDAGGDDQSGDDQSGDDKSGDDKSGDDKSGDDKSGDDQSGDDQSGDDQSGDDQSGDDQSGDDQSGDDQSGDDQSGDDQSGDDQGSDTGSGL